MQSNSLRKEVPIIRQLKCQPYVTVLMTFDPSMSPKYILESKLKALTEKIKIELYENYSFDAAKEVSEKMASIISKLDYNTHKKSIAILVSAEVQKVYYRDVRVEEKFFVSNGFQYQDLVHFKKDEREYLLLVMSSVQAALYRGKGETITRILLNVLDHKTNNDQSGNDLKNSSIKQDKVTRAFLESVDRNLSILLNAFPFPVFVLGSEDIIREYSRLTLNDDAICNYVEGAFDDASEDEIEKVVEPFIRNWRKVKDAYLVQKLETAIEYGKIAVGIQDVWNLAKRKNIKHLVVEEGYEYHSYLGKGMIICAEEATNSAFIKDAVEDIIEKVLEDGGEIDYVSKGGLKDFLHIAAIRNY
jgi:hypothetical protein